MRKNNLDHSVIGHLANLSIEELRRKWAAAWGRVPHTRIGRSMLEKSLACKQLGQGLTADQQKRLEQLGDILSPRVKPMTRWLGEAEYEPANSGFSFCY